MSNMPAHLHVSLLLPLHLKSDTLYCCTTAPIQTWGPVVELPANMHLRHLTNPTQVASDQRFQQSKFFILTTDTPQTFMYRVIQ